MRGAKLLWAMAPGTVACAIGTAMFLTFLFHGPMVYAVPSLILAVLSLLHANLQAHKWSIRR